MLCTALARELAEDQRVRVRTMALPPPPQRVDAVPHWCVTVPRLPCSPLPCSVQVHLSAPRGLPWLDLPNVPVVQNLAAAVNDALYSWSQVRCGAAAGHPDTWG